MSLRRKIGVSSEPFTPLPRDPPLRRHYERYDRIVAEIGELEAKLIGHLRRDVNDVLERRIKLRGLK